MANGFLAPFLTGALTELQQQKRTADDIAASVVDTVSQHVLGRELPEQQELIKKQEALKNSYATTYSQKVADGMDAMGLFESGDEAGLFNAVKIRFGDRYSLPQIAKKIENTKDEDYAKLIQTSFIGTRKSALKDRTELVDSVLSDTKNIKDLLIGEKPTGIAKFIGEPLGRGDEAKATLNLKTALEGPSATPPVSADATKLLGLDMQGEGEVFDFNNARHTQRLNQARQNFDKQFFNQQLGSFNFSFGKDDPRQKTADFITAGYDEAVKNGYKLGKVDYAREKYIDYILESQFGITGYIPKPAGTATQVQPGTAPETQTGPKITESQTVLGSEDIGAVSGKPVTGETTKETIEKTEKVTVPKSTKPQISTGDSAPAPSEIPQKAPGLILANDGMLYSRGKAVKMYAPAEREIEEAQGIAFQIKVRDDLSDEEKATRLDGLRKLLISELSGMGITQYVPTF